MNEGFPPLELPDPERRSRKSEKPRRAPLSADVLARRHEIAQVLHATVEILSKEMKGLSDDERKAIFYKLEHDIPLSRETFSGTGLKPVRQPSADVTFVAPVDATLDRLEDKIQQFGGGPVRDGHVANEWLARLQSIEKAAPTDRLSDDLRDAYATLTSQPWVICEIELLSFKKGTNQQREEISQWLAELQAAFASGLHGHLFEHELALPTCCAVIRCTGVMFRTIVESPIWISRIRWIESRPQFQTFHEVWEQFHFDQLAPIPSPEPDAPVICVIDTGVSSGNPFLTPVTRDELLRSYLCAAPDNPSDEFGHGSAVASLAAYYALNLADGAENRPKAWIAGARILNANNELEDERLFSSLLAEVVRDFSAKGVRIFCLSVGDSRRIWNTSSRRSFPRKSWVARRIDQLSREYDVVFITCVGNLFIQDIQQYLDDGQPYPHYLPSSDARILDPGQASIAMTVGSIARGTVVVTSSATAIALENQPSPFTRSGPGIRGEIKPELVEYGGNMALDPSTDRVIVNRGLQVVAASHQLTPAACLKQGTSFAAPRVAFKAAQILRDLQSLGFGQPSACLLRALLVNSASRKDPAGRLPDIEAVLKVIDADAVNHVLGYGLPDDVRATYCDDFSSVSIYDGEIAPDEVLFFDIPIPAELSQSTQEKILTITVAHAPEVQRWGLERYHGIDLKWRMFRGNINRDDVVAAMSQEVSQTDEDIGDETDEQETADLPSELKCQFGLMRRSRGTIQHDCHVWKQHRADYSDGHYTLAVAAYKRWSRKVEPSSLAVVVRLEEIGQSVHVYSLQLQAFAALRAEAQA